MAAAALSALAAVCYTGRLAGPFLFDDQVAIVENTTLRELGPALFSPPRETPVAGRPVVNLTFALDYARAGLAPAAFHFSNLVLHGLCSWALLLFLRRALRAARMPEVARRYADRCACVASLLFCAHPLATEVVLYTSQRSEVLVALAYLATLYLIVRDAAALGESGSIAERGTARGRVGLGWVGAIGLLGAGSKEVFVTAPVVALCFDRAFVTGSFARALRVRRGFYLALCPALLLLGLLQLSNPRPESVRWFEVDYLAAQAEVVPRYFALALWPARLTLDYGPLWPGRAGPAWPWWVGGALGLVGTAAAILRWPRAGFLPLIVVALLAPSSSVISIHTEIGAERRFYLPLAALISYVVVAGSAVAVRVSRLGDDPRRLALPLRGAGVVLICAALVAMVARTRSRGLDYASLQRAWQVAVEARPGNARAHYNLAETLRRGGDAGGAIREYEAALALREAYPDAHTNLGGVLIARGEFARGLRHAARAASLAPESAQLRVNHGIALGLSGDAAAAVSELREAVRLRPHDLELRARLATALAVAGQRGEARMLASQILTQVPGHHAALHLLRSLD